MLRPTPGTVLLGDHDLTGRRPERIRAAGVAVVPEGRRLLPELTVEDNLRVATYALEPRRRPSAARVRARAVPRAQAAVDAPRRGSLSGGEQQMVVLAQALVSRPSVLLVDELSLGLAPVVVKRLVPTLAAVAETGVGVLLIEQFAHVALGPGRTGLHPRGRPDPLRRHARELRENPELLHSAYLLRGSPTVGNTHPGSSPRESGP